MNETNLQRWSLPSQSLLKETCACVWAHVCVCACVCVVSSQASQELPG